VVAVTLTEEIEIEEEATPKK